ncbi:FecR family protein [Algirhabdus cladophorae]|uniref:FecR family protein n=1 Tax=Algirhabdus cladophorae TaxID=3377108 RepID=UPI003B846892
MRWTFQKLSTVCALAVCFSATLPTAVSAQDIGTVASLTPQMQGQLAGAAPTRLRVGSTVVADQTIITGSRGRGQLLFVDETTLSVAPQSRITLDRFIYDPNRGAGEIGLSLARGALRFIGGKATDRQPAEIVTPTGTISIRGSSALVVIQNGQTFVVFVAGERLCFAVANGKRSCTNRRGGVLSEDGYLGKISQPTLAGFLARIDGATVPAGSNRQAGSGIDGQNPNNRNPLSTNGESYDENGPDAPFDTLTVEGILSADPMAPDPVADPLPEPVEQEPVEEEEEEEEPIGREIGF